MFRPSIDDINEWALLNYEPNQMEADLFVEEDNAERLSQMIFMLVGHLAMKKKRTTYTTHIRWQKDLEFVKAGSQSPRQAKNLNGDSLSVTKKDTKVVTKDMRDTRWHCHEILNMIVEQARK